MMPSIWMKVNLTSILVNKRIDPMMMTNLFLLLNLTKKYLRVNLKL